MQIRYALLLQKLSRVTQSTAVIPEIDGLRFLAIMPVVLLHLCTNYLRVNPVGFSKQTLAGSDYFFHLLNKGSLGVHVFFVISGFVLALPFAAQYLKGGKKVELKPYYMRRLTRLEPPFIISMVLFFFSWLIVGKYSLSELLNSLWASLLYVHYFVMGKWSIINPISWSLETEVQFYVLAPFLFLIFLVRSWKFRLTSILIFAFGVIIFVAGQKQFIVSYHLSKSLVIYFPLFLTGIVLADFYTRSASFFNKKSYVWDVLGIVGLFATYYFHHYSAWYGFLIQNMGIALVFLAAFKGRIFNIIFTRKEIVVIGGMCYSIYLIHYGLLYLLMFITGSVTLGNSFTVNYLVQTIIVVPIILIVSSIFFLLFEKPFMYRGWYKDFPKGYFSRLLK